jgi:hypothetical protein
MQVYYASLYSEALNDPLLKRTRVELETAMSNAVEARKVVFELFQDLDGFRLDDYKAMGNPEEGMGALVRFIADAASAEGETFTSLGDKLFGWIPKILGPRLKFFRHGHGRDDGIQSKKRCRGARSESLSPEDRREPLQSARRPQPRV